jgi:hypothetical protein
MLFNIVLINNKCQLIILIAIQMTTSNIDKWCCAVFVGNTIAYPFDILKNYSQCYKNLVLINQNVKQFIPNMFTGYTYFIGTTICARSLTFAFYNKMVYEYKINAIQTTAIISAISATIVTPFDLQKMQKQFEITNNKTSETSKTNKTSETNKTSKYSSKFNFRGLNFTFCRDCASTGFYFPIYYYLQDKKQSCANGFVAGLTSKLFSHPFDTLKTLKQMNMCVTISPNIQTWKLLYRGFKYESVRTCISSGIIFNVYNWMLNC